MADFERYLAGLMSVSDAFMLNFILRVKLLLHLHLYTLEF